MKSLILILFPLTLLAQKKEPIVGMGLTMGWSLTKSTLIGESYLSIDLKRNFVIYPLAIKIHAIMSNPTIPCIFETRAGYKVKSFEFWAGPAYNMAGSDGKPEFKKYTGLRGAGGVIYHYRKLIVTGSVSGLEVVNRRVIGIYSFGVGFFGRK